MPSDYLDPGSNHIPMSPMSVCYRDAGWSGSRNMGFTVIEQGDGDHDLPMKDFQNYIHIHVIPFACCYSQCVEVIEFVALPLYTWPFHGIMQNVSHFIKPNYMWEKQFRSKNDLHGHPGSLTANTCTYAHGIAYINTHTWFMHACCVHTSGHYVTVHKSA